MTPIRRARVLVCSALVFGAIYDTTARPRDFRFSAGNAALCIPFDDANRQISIETKLNGKRSVWMSLDSGSSGSVLDETLAEAMGLPPVGRQRSLGSGGPQEGGMVRGVDVALPGFELLDQPMDTLSLASLSAQMARPFGGILGHPLFERCVVEIDYTRRCLSLFAAQGYRYRGRGTVVPIELIETHPYVRARLVLPDDRVIEGRFVIDTGGSGGLMLSPTVAEREGVVASLGKTLTVPSFGVGGGVGVRLGRIKRLELGGFSLAGPIVAVPPPGAGRVSAPGTVGNIAGGILSRFKVTFDYPRGRMILEAGPGLGEPFDMDMSGLALVAPPPEFQRVTVARVIEGSPAYDAGVEAGDEILSVDGAPAGEIGVPALRERLRREGREVRLELKRGSQTLALVLHTRRLI